MQTEAETFTGVCRFQGGGCGAPPLAPTSPPARSGTWRQGARVGTALPAGTGLGRSTRGGGGCGNRRGVAAQAGRTPQGEAGSGSRLQVRRPACASISGSVTWGRGSFPPRPPQGV